MPKYYYTDPLKAVWMSSNFGMTFTYDLYNPPHLFSIGCFEKGEGQAIFKKMGASKDKKLYIHPDSLYLLEPQVGDLVYASVARNKGFFVYDQDKEPVVDKIIQRNSIPFMSPEVEA